MWGDALADAREIAADLYPEPTEEDAEKLVYGNSAITYMQKGLGRGFRGRDVRVGARPERRRPVHRARDQETHGSVHVIELDTDEEF